MPERKVFNVEKKKDKKATMSLNRNIFEDEGKIGGAVQKKIKRINTLLATMYKKMDKKLSEDEMSAAMLAVEHRLEKSIPTNFLPQYKKSDDWSEAADLVQSNILDDLNTFVTKKTLSVKTKKFNFRTLRFKKVIKKNVKTELDRYIQVTDNEDISDLDTDEATNVMKKLNKKLTKKELKEFRNRYANDNLIDKENVFAGGTVAAREPGGSNSRRAADDAMNMK